MTMPTLTPLQKSVLQVLQSGAMSTSQIKSGLAKLGWARATDDQIEAALNELSAMELIEAGSDADSSKAKRLLDIEERLHNLELGNEDVRAELLRDRNRLMGGDPNKTDQQLLEEYYAPLVAKVRGA